MGFVDRAEAAILTTEMEGMLRERSSLIAESAALVLRMESNGQRVSEIDIDILQMLLRPLRSASRQDLTALAVPVIEGTSALDVLTRVRGMGRDAWLDTLVGLGRSCRLPVIRPMGKAEWVVGLAHRVAARLAAHRGERCQWCGQGWIEDICKRRVHRICATCHRITPTRITLPPPCIQPPLW